MQNVAAKIREARTEQGFRREDLALATGLSHGTIQGYEQGVRSPRLGSLQKIAEATGKPVAWFFEEVAA